MFGGKVLDAGALASYLDGRLVVVSWLAIAPDTGLVLYLPDLVLHEVAAVCPNDGPRLSALLSHPHLVHGQLDTAAAPGVRRALAKAGVWDGTAGAVVHAARSRGWPVLSGDPDRLLRVDPGLDIEVV